MRIKFLSFFFCLITLFLPSIGKSHEYKVVGYYPNWAIYRPTPFYPKDIDCSLLTHINYAFAKVDTAGNIHLIDSWADIEYRSDWNTEKPYWGNFRALFDLKQKHPHLKTLISIGGWTLSDTFSSLANNSAARSNFVRNAIDFCKRYGFDGIDIDWEYPGFAEHSGRPQDKENFPRLLEELYQAAKAEKPSLLVTIAAPAGPWHCQNMEISKIHQFVDWINLMTYDFHGPWSDADNTVTNHQSALFPSSVGSPELCVYSALQHYLERGIPSKKLVLGMPLYGRVFANSNGLYSPYNGAGNGTTAEKGVRFFSDIKQNLLHPYFSFWDEEAQASYLYNPDNKEFITYDSEQALRIKGQLIKQLGLGGAMVWELGLDVRPSWDGLHAVVDELN